jgi:aerobic C4-dicarboxylate transport protein
VLYVQVLATIAFGVLLGYFVAAMAVEMQPLGDRFIKLIKMVIALVVFFTVVSGVSGMQDLGKGGRAGIKSLLYFEIVSTVALALGLVVANVFHPDAGFHTDPAHLKSKAVAQYAGAAHEQGMVPFLMNIIPDSVLGAFARGDILPVARVFGIVLSSPAHAVGGVQRGPGHADRMSAPRRRAVIPPVLRLTLPVSWPGLARPPTSGMAPARECRGWPGQARP